MTAGSAGGSARGRGLLAAAAVACLLSSGASRAAASDDGTGTVWEPQSVRFPVRPAGLRASRPFSLDRARDTRGPVEVAPGRAAAFWLDPVSFARVRVLSGNPEAVRFGRVEGGDDQAAVETTLIVEETPQVVGPGRWYLVQPPPTGAVWFVTADEKVRVAIDRAVQRSQRLVWTKVRDKVFRWIDGKGEMPDLPAARGASELVIRLRADAAVAALATMHFDSALLDRALRLWRKASADMALSKVRRHHSPFMIDDDLIDGKAGVGGREQVFRGGSGRLHSPVEYHRHEGPNARWRVKLTGPGVLDLSVRAVWPERRKDRVLELSVSADGVEIARDQEKRSPLRVARDNDWERPFPRFEALQTARGERVSPAQNLSVPLLLGTHTYEINVSGGPMLIDATVWRSRGRLRGWLAGTRNPARLAKRAREAVTDSPSAQAFVEALVGPMAGVRRQIPSGLPPALELALMSRAAVTTDPKEEGARAQLLARAADLIASLPPTTDPDLVAAAQIDLAGAGRRWGLAASVEDLLRRATVPPRPAAVAAIALVVPEEPRRGRRSRTLAGAIAAWAQRPLESAIRATLLRLWFDRTLWSALRPVQPGVDEDREHWWYRTARPRRKQRSPFRIVTLTDGAPQSIEVGRLLAAPKRPGRLRVFAVGPPGASASLRIDEERYQLAVDGRAAVAEFAVAPGQHDVEVEAPPGVVAFVAVPRDQEQLPPEPTPGTRSRWRLTPERPVDIELPDQGLPGLIRLELRAPNREYAEPIELAMSVDDGPPRRLLLRPGSVDPTWMPKKGAHTVSGRVAAALWLPDYASRVRLTTSAPVWFSFAVRRAHVPGPPQVAEAAAPSRALFGDPTLIDLARHDQLQLDDAVSHPAERPYSLRHVVAHLAARGGVTHWPWQQDWGAVELVWPARGALLRAAPQADRWLSKYRAARALDLEGQHLAAARSLGKLARESGVWQIGLEALAAARRRPPRRTQDKALIYSLALDLASRASIATVWRGLVEFSRDTSVSRVSDWDETAGYVRAYGGRPAREQGPRTLFQNRAASPPWSSDVSTSIRSGRKSRTTVKSFATTDARLRVWCRPVDSTASCRVRWRLDDGPLRELDVAPGVVGEGPPVSLPAGEHRVEYQLANGRGVASALLVDGDGAPIFERYRRRFELAEPERPAKTKIVGPAVLWIEARSIGGARELSVSLRRTGRKKKKTRRSKVALPLEPDASLTMESASAVLLARPGFALINVPKNGRYELSMEPDAGVAALRVVSVKHEPEAPVETAPEVPPERPAPVRTPTWASSRLSVLGDAAPPAPRALPTTLSLEMIAGIDDRTDRADDDDSLQNRFELRARWRHQMIDGRWWLGAQLGMRTLSSATSFNVGVDSYLRGLPLGVRLNGRARVYAQNYGDERAARVASSFRLDRSFVTGATAFGLPALTVKASHYTLSESSLVDDDVPDPLVFTSFGTTHDKSIGLEWGHYWLPFFDQMGWAVVRATSNEDLTTVDRFEALAGWRGIIEVGDLMGPEFRVIYRPSWRLADLNRRESIVRHDVLLRFDWTVWTGRAGRFVFSLDNDLYLSADVASRVAVRLGVRFDWTGERSIRDFLPTERDFEDIVEQRLWGAYR